MYFMGKSFFLLLNSANPGIRINIEFLTIQMVTKPNNLMLSLSQIIN